MTLLLRVTLCGDCQVPAVLFALCRPWQEVHRVHVMTAQTPFLHAHDDLVPFLCVQARQARPTCMMAVAL